MALSQVRVSVPAVKAVFELGPIIVLKVSPTRYLVSARRIFWHFRSRPRPRFCLSSLIHPRARTQDRVIRCHRYPLKTCHTGTLPFAAEAGAIPAVAGRLAVPAAAELPDAGGGAMPPFTTNISCIAYLRRRGAHFTRCAGARGEGKALDRRVTEVAVRVPRAAQQQAEVRPPPPPPPPAKT